MSAILLFFDGVQPPPPGPAFLFEVGDLVFAPDRTGSRYLQQGVRQRLASGARNYYSVGLGWFAEDLLLTAAQYRALLCRTQARQTLAGDKLELFQSTCLS